MRDQNIYIGDAEDNYTKMKREGVDNYTMFKTHIDGFISGLLNFNEEMVMRDPKAVPDSTEEREANQIRISKNFYEAHVFNMDEDIKKLLCMTKPDTQKIENMPFPEVFIPVDFSGYDFNIDTNKRCIGVLIKQGVADASIINKDETHKIKVTEVVTMSINDDSGKDIIYFDKFMFDAEFLEGSGILKEVGEKVLDIKYNNTWGKQVRYLLHKFVINFLNLLQDPEIRLVYVERNEKNQTRRIKQGKPVLPSMTNITLTGKINEYVNSLKTGTHFSYSHKFWVSGHWKHFNSERYKDAKGKKKWVLPYKKGEGILHQKEYEIKGEE